MHKLYGHPYSTQRRTLLKATLAGTGALLCASPLLAQGRRLAKPGATVTTQQGKVRGLVRDGIQQFWGISYGATTEKNGRFMPPAPPPKFSGVEDRFSIGPRCWQQPGAGEPAPVVLAMNRLEPESEDCLKLNIFTPGTDNKARAVMVWMHGGGFASGSGNYLIYDGTYLAMKEDVVVVSVTHRLNLFGFLHLADLGDARFAHATNAGVQDLVAAQAWVRDNIAAFGGDPGRVTIFGQSGGGSKTTTLMAMPSAKGLFHRCIAQSGAALTGTPREAATEATKQLLARLNIAPNQLTRLQEIPVQELQKAFYSEPAIRNLASGPVIDGSVLPANQWDPAAPAYSADVPLLAGSTQTENGWIGPPPFEMEDAEMAAQFARQLTKGNADEAAKLIALYKTKYPGLRNRMLWLTAESDNTRRWNAQLLCRLKAEQNKAASWLYFFNWASPVHDNRMGAYHTLDIPFVFYNVDVAASMTGAAQYRYQLAHVMSAAWAAFARNGNPNHADMPKWDAFNAAQYPTMVFGNEIKQLLDPNKDERIALARYR